jgi:2-methylcitrate dehydratase
MRRRDLLKLGAGVVLTSMAAEQASSQERGRGSTRPAARPLTQGAPRPAGELRPHTGPGYKNDYNRLGGNGPMDDTTRKIVKFVREFSEANLTPAVTAAVNRTMVDSMAALVSGFEGEACRVAARLARLSPPGELKSTVLGYGISTTPELAAFANGCLIRHTDFNDNAPGGHNSDLITAALAVGEALHSTGADVMTAITIGYELKAVPAGGESVAAAMTAGKLMKLDEDRLANAVGMALIPHVALNKGVGALSMWKGVRTAEATKCGVWSALMAREGMTGPPQPFEGRGSAWADRGPGRPFTLPDQAELSIERTWAKRFPSDAQSQGVLVLLPEIRSWTTVDDIESIQYDMTLDNWQEVGSAPKWDPRNRETADHSLPYLLARGLMDGDIYIDSFKSEKILDPKVRELMARMTLGPVVGWRGLGTGRLTIRKKSGEQKYWDTLGGSRNPELEDYRRNVNMTDQEIAKKFDRACAYMQVTGAQRDRARAVWSNLREIKDIGEAIQTLAKFGKPLPLSTTSSSPRS